MNTPDPINKCPVWLWPWTFASQPSAAAGPAVGLPAVLSTMAAPAIPTMSPRVQTGGRGPASRHLIDWELAVRAKP